MTKDEYVTLLKLLGHYNAAAVRKTEGKQAGRFYVVCECGYQSATRTSLRLAVEAIEHHRRLALRAAKASGVSLPSVTAGA